VIRPEWTMVQGLLSNMFAEGGWPMYPVLVTGLVAVLFAIAYVARSERKVLATPLVAIALTAAFGVGGTLFDRATVDDVLAHVAVEDVEAIRTVGYAESMRPVQLAGVFVVLASAVLAADLLGRKRA